jgi:endonuclease YncB( thermonuclease family)
MSPKTSSLLALAAFLALLVATIAFAPPDGGGFLNLGKPAGAGLIVIDGDEVRSGDRTYRLVGFDAPERGDRALCDKERDLAETATARLQSLIAGGDAKLEPLPCACKPGTEGTRDCNLGRSCATLKLNGSDVGPLLIGEGLAKRLVCGATSCPPREPWC